MVDMNPWAVENINEFLYFCCPECDERNQSKEYFIQHALEKHPKAKECLPQIEIKLEPKEENFANEYLLEEEFELKEDLIDIKPLKENYN